MPHLIRPATRITALLSGLLLAAASLAGCSTAAQTPADDTPSSPASGSAAPSWPRTIHVPAGSASDAAELEIPAEPLRIAALTYEAAETVAALGLADRLVVIPAAVQHPTLTNHLAEMTVVETTVPSESETDPELIISLAPDLVVLSARHGLESGAGKVLADAGIPTLLLPNSWSDVEDLLLDVQLIAAATGADEAGATLVQTLRSGLPVTTTTGEAPRVLVLSNQAGRSFVTAGAAFPLALLGLAGGTDAGAEAGFTRTGPITAEQVVDLDPDAILLIDMNGSERRLFADVLDNEAVRQLPAVAEDRILLLPGRQTQALGLAATIDGLAAIHDWLQGLSGD